MTGSRDHGTKGRKDGGKRFSGSWFLVPDRWLAVGGWRLAGWRFKRQLMAADDGLAAAKRGGAGQLIGWRGVRLETS